MIINISVPYISIPLFAINLLAFLVMMLDKMKSTNPKAERFSERALFLLAFIFGAIGIYIGMFTFRHKTRKWSFKIGIPLLIVLNVATVYFIYSFFIS